MTEFFDLYDAERRPLGRRKERALVHRDGDWHRSIHLWIVRTDGRLVFQRRSASKDTMPGLLTASVGGHYSAGERLPDVLREALEELGRPVREKDLIPLGWWRYHVDTEPGVLDREWQEVFFWPLDIALTELRPDPAEVTALVELAPGDLLRLLDGEAQQIDAAFVRAGAVEVEQAPVTVHDFVPSHEYHARIAHAAIAYGRGERPSLGEQP